MPRRGSARYRVSNEAEFPDILLPQAGWRASDEGDNEGRPRMGTTKPWRVMAHALKQLAQKQNIQAKGPVTRRLLELAKNPPLARG